MPDSPNRVALDRVDWSAVLPVLRLVSAFRHALQPGKLIVALLAVLLIHLSGSVFDLMWGKPIEAYGSETGIYEWIASEQQQAFNIVVHAAISFELGLGGDTPGVLGGLKRMFVEIPGRAFSQHPWFTLLFGADVLFILALASGLICRMAATQACAGHMTALPAAARFVCNRLAWYLLTPLMPTLLILILGGVLILAGLALFNAPWLDLVGAALYGPLLVLGFVIALVTVLLIFALCLMAPALSVEGTDGFDAIARSFNYIMFKPWQFAGYLLGAVVYAAVVYVLVSSLAGLTFDATAGFIEVGAIAEVDGEIEDGVSRFEAIRSDPEGPSDSIGPSAWVVRQWHGLLAALVIAVMFSVVCCLQTQVYVLMRRCADGTPLDDCAADDEQEPWSSPKDMVDPEAQAIAEAGPSSAKAPTNDADRPAAEE